MNVLSSLSAPMHAHMCMGCAGGDAARIKCMPAAAQVRQEVQAPSRVLRELQEAGWKQRDICT